jgi:hypothetical protein
LTSLVLTLLYSSFAATSCTTAARLRLFHHFRLYDSFWSGFFYCYWGWLFNRCGYSNLGRRSFISTLH